MEVVEWLGADLFVHFDVRAEGGRRLAALQQELDLDGGHDGVLRLVARLGAESAAAAGETLALAIDPEGLLLFDGESGERLPGDAT